MVIKFWHSPERPDEGQEVTVTAEAGDDESGLDRIEIQVPGQPLVTCWDSPCEATGGPYPPGEFSYEVRAFDRAGNVASHEGHFAVAATLLPADVRLISELRLSNTTPNVGESVNATFTVRNNGGQTFIARYFGVKGRGPNDSMQDFLWIENVSIAPGDEYAYSRRRSFSTPGEYWFTPHYSPDGTNWIDITWPDGQTGYVYITVGVLSPADLTVQSIDRIDVNCVSGSCTTTVNFTIANVGTASAGPFKVLIRGDPGLGQEKTVGINGLAAGETMYLYESLPSDGNCYDPDCTVCITVDSGGHVVESNEENNELCETWGG